MNNLEYKKGDTIRVNLKSMGITDPKGRGISDVGVVAGSFFGPISFIVLENGDQDNYMFDANDVVEIIKKA